MSLPQVASRGEWLIGREEVLAQDRAATRVRDAVGVQRRRLPMVKLDKGYVFEGPGGTATLLDLFGGMRRLLVCHFLLDPEGAQECASCSAAAEEVSSDLLARLRRRDTALVAVSHAPLAAIGSYQARRGWEFPWYSCFGSDFDYDFHARREYRDPGDIPGRHAFQHQGARLFHAYSMFARRAETVGSWCYWLDLTARAE
ncbi:DUF899 family protein [Nocardia sp.]|uniref:DUF899 family protein n=1 Tax=Nocardia sp. TaxID=1821 RepID=UPI0026306595|nr:DUF899 family protein [Nocardia sp.]